MLVELVYKQANKILGAANELTILLDDLMKLPSGEIKIGIPPLIGTFFFRKSLKALESYIQGFH